MVNFLSLFTNPEMQESEIKECLWSEEIMNRIIADNNAIRDEEKMKKIVVDAVLVFFFSDS